MYSRVALQPVQGVAPVVPTMQAGPSPLSLIGALGSAAVSGVSTYADLKANNPFKDPPPGPKPAPAPPPPSAPKSFTNFSPSRNFMYDSNAQIFSQSYA